MRTKYGNRESKSSMKGCSKQQQQTEPTIRNKQATRNTTTTTTTTSPRIQPLLEYNLSSNTTSPRIQPPRIQPPRIQPPRITGKYLQKPLLLHQIIQNRHPPPNKLIQLSLRPPQKGILPQQSLLSCDARISFNLGVWIFRGL
jgi:hypothetical protein